MRRHVASSAKPSFAEYGEDAPDLELSTKAFPNDLIYRQTLGVGKPYSHIDSIMRWGKRFLRTTGLFSAFGRLVAALIVMCLLVGRMILGHNDSIRIQYISSGELWGAAGYDLSRVYPIDDKERNWCQPNDDENNSTTSGLLFIKVTKCASSTGAGITLNMAHNHRKSDSTDCFASVGHGDTQRLPLLSRNRDKSILWTILRHPADRALSSYFFFQVSRKGDIPNDDDIIEYCEKEKNAMFKMMTEASLANLTIEEIVQEMDFIAISERMAESLVVFRLLYGLDPEDMIVLPSKQTGQYDDGRSGFGCKKILSGIPSPFIDDYMATEFVQDNDDYILYTAANATLDRTIEAIGKDVVEREVKRHNALQKIAEKKCVKKAVFPCMEGKIHMSESRKSCYENDWGCGHECVRRVLKERGDLVDSP